MKLLSFALGATICLSACGAASTSNSAAPAASATTAASSALTFKAADGLTVFARRYDAAHPKALILLFHQAGSSKDEYATIAPRLVAAGYSAVAVDARAGGGLYGENETARALGLDADFLDARQDLQAALDWAATRKLPVILWGSSYSSSLVFPLAAANQGKVAALLSISPGEYFDNKTLVGRAASQVTVPVFVTSASSADEIAAARAVVGAVPGARAEQYVPVKGVHGSSTLIAAKNAKGAEANWTAVLAFLAKVAP